VPDLLLILGRSTGCDMWHIVDPCSARYYNIQPIAICHLSGKNCARYSSETRTQHRHLRQRSRTDRPSHPPQARSPTQSSMVRASPSLFQQVSPRRRPPRQCTLSPTSHFLLHFRKLPPCVHITLRYHACVLISPDCRYPGWQ
jgi:hypothetical protein